VHEVIVSPFLDNYVVVRPGDTRAVRIGPRRYHDLLEAAPGAACPTWLADAIRQRWDLDLAEQPLASAVLVRKPSPLGYGRASYEINLGCDYDCEHCYLGRSDSPASTWQANKDCCTSCGTRACSGSRSPAANH
jgi:hypothetical protein